MPVEAGLTLIGLDDAVVEGATWAHDEALLERVRRVNPLVQIPALLLPGGESLTESGAMPFDGRRMIYGGFTELTRF